MGLQRHSGKRGPCWYKFGGQAASLQTFGHREDKMGRHSRRGQLRDVPLPIAEEGWLVRRTAGHVDVGRKFHVIGENRNSVDVDILSRQLLWKGGRYTLRKLLGGAPFQVSNDGLWGGQIDRARKAVVVK